MNITEAIRAILYIAAGVGLGGLYFFLLFRAVQMHAGRAAAALIVPAHLSRLVLAAVAFALVAQQGALPLLLTLLGFLIARTILQHRLGWQQR